MKKDPSGIRAISSPLATLAALLFLGVAASQAEVKVVRILVSTQESLPTDEVERRAALRAEANSPGMTKAQWTRVKAVYDARKAKAERELAMYERFKFERQLALAEASASKTYVYINGQTPADLSSGQFRGNSTGSAVENVPGVTYVRPQREETSSSRKSTRYPDRFYRRSAQDSSFDRQDVRLDAQEAREDAQALLDSAPFGVPVPGRPGYMSSPVQRFRGYIDVRDYSPGSTVIDPYTGERVRVPIIND